MGTKGFGLSGELRTSPVNANPSSGFSSQSQMTRSDRSPLEELQGALSIDGRVDGRHAESAQDLAKQIDRVLVVVDDQDAESLEPLIVHMVHVGYLPRPGWRQLRAGFGESGDSRANWLIKS
ncbi:MAG: hypothetical protein V3S95_07145 [Alphaproteobacteria bacterium]